MTWSNFWGDVFDGNFTHAFKRLSDFFETWPQWLQDFVKELAKREGVILSNLADIAADVLLADAKNLANLKSADIIAQAKSIWEQLKSQNIDTFTLQDVFVMLNGALSSKGKNLDA